MKKVFVVLLSLVLAACLMSCDNSNPDPSTGPTESLGENEAFEVVKAVADVIFEFQTTGQQGTPYEATNGYTLLSYSMEQTSSTQTDVGATFYAPDSRVHQTLKVVYTYEMSGTGGSAPIITSFIATLNGTEYDFTDRADEIVKV